MALSYGVPEVAVEILETLIHRYEVQGALTPVHAIFLEVNIVSHIFDRLQMAGASQADRVCI